jgi:hypothetical protein
VANRPCTFLPSKLVCLNCPTWLNSVRQESIVCHRSDLHDELIRLATGESGGGPPVQLLLNSKVATCDADGGIVTLADGEIVHADIVIGADGIHVRYFPSRLLEDPNAIGTSPLLGPASSDML